VETHNDRDQAPGHISGHETVTTTQVQSSTGGVHNLWESGSGTALGVIGSPGAWFKQQNVSASEGDFWDSRCS
jgi:hypothetical protein